MGVDHCNVWNYRGESMKIILDCGSDLNFISSPLNLWAAASIFSSICVDIYFIFREHRYYSVFSEGLTAPMLNESIFISLALFSAKGFLHFQKTFFYLGLESSFLTFRKLLFWHDLQIVRLKMFRLKQHKKGLYK